MDNAAIILKCWLSPFVFNIFLIKSLQSFTLRGDSKSPGCAQKSWSRSAAPTPPKRRNSVLWSEMLDVNTKESLSTKEIKRQEVTPLKKQDSYQSKTAFICSWGTKNPFHSGYNTSPMHRTWFCLWSTNVNVISSLSKRDKNLFLSIRSTWRELLLVHPLNNKMKGSVSSLARRGITTFEWGCIFCAPKAQIYVCSRNGKRWMGN